MRRRATRNSRTLQFGSAERFGRHSESKRKAFPLTNGEPFGEGCLIHVAVGGDAQVDAVCLPFLYLGIGTGRAASGSRFILNPR